jgi:ribosomal protein S18 acetylase RimI-like enzyme
MHSAKSVSIRTAQLEIARVTPGWEAPLAKFFQLLVDSGDDRHFHPHPLTLARARELTAYTGDDLYYVVVDDHFVLAYGMLRGWDEGYATPSLGIAVHPCARGSGLAETFMHFLHSAARLRGCSRIRLTVSTVNTRAIALYRRLGYTFDDLSTEPLVGFRDLV